jgi:hypothetical protein
MWNTLWSYEECSRARAEIFLGDHHSKLAFQDVADLVCLLVPVRRREIPGRIHRLDDRESATGLTAMNLEGDLGADKRDDSAFARLDDYLLLTDRHLFLSLQNATPGSCSENPHRCLLRADI